MARFEERPGMEAPRDDGDGRGHGQYKEFWLTSFSVNHPTSVLVLTAIIIIAGLISYISVPKEAAPEITIPIIAVNTVYPGVAPEDIETLLTRPLEDELNKIADVEEITSTSVEGYSNINVEFVAGMDMTEALQLVREKVDIAKPELPEAAEEPMIIEFNFAEWPIMQVNISGEYSLVRLKKVAEDLEDKLEQIPSVLDVTLSGGLEREVQVDVDLAKLKYYGLAFDDVIDAIREENVTTPGGTIDVGTVKYLVRVPGEFEDTRLIEDIVIASPGDRPVYLRDVATVDFGFKERDSFARLDRRSVVTLGVKKRVGRNIIETADAVRAIVAELEPTFPPTTVVKVTSDQSEDVHEMVSSLENNIISGLILVVAVLLFALGLRTASFVGIAIPLSMFLSFSIIQLVGMTMNFIVLFSLILALGMLVDNAIVVVENIYRFRERGLRQERGGEARHRRGGGPGDGGDGDDAGGFRADDVLARNRRRVHGLFAQDADHHPQLLAVRGFGDQPDPLLPMVAARGQPGPGLDPRYEMDARRRGLRRLPGDLRLPAATGGVAGADGGAALRAAQVRPGSGGALAAERQFAGGTSRLRTGAALGAGPPLHRDGSGRSDARGGGGDLRPVQRGRGLLPRGHPAKHGLRAGGSAHRHEGGCDGSDRANDRGRAGRA